MTAYTITDGRTVMTTGSPATWIKAIYDGLIAVGLEQTTDTGQLDLSTTSPNAFDASNFDYGYSVFKWTDSYQTTYPIFIKVNYRNDGFYNYRGVLQITVGQGSNGSGTITGTTQTLYLSSSSYAISSTLLPSYISYKDGNLCIAMTPDNTDYNIRKYYSIGRLYDNNGIVKNGIWMEVIGCFSYAVYYNEYIISPDRTTVGSWTHSSSITQNSPCFFPYMWTSEGASTIYTEGSDTYTPIIAPYMQTPRPRTALTHMYVSSAISTEFTFTRHGVSRTYKPLVLMANPNSNTELGMAMLWE